MLHSLQTHAFIWITRGQGICTIEGLRSGVGVHNAFAIPARTLFSFDLGKQGFGLITLIPAQSPVLMPDDPHHLRIRDAQQQAELTTILDALQREQNNNRPFVDEAMQAQAQLLTVWLRRALISQEDPPVKKSAATQLVQAYSALLERDFRSDRPMADYARKLGVTPTHLTRTCRKTAGLSAADMLTQRTLHAACDMLVGGTMPVQQIAATLGFNSAAYFSRFILKHCGQSPSALRKSARIKPASPLSAKPNNW